MPWRYLSCSHVPGLESMWVHGWVLYSIVKEEHAVQACVRVCVCVCIKQESTGRSLETSAKLSADWGGKRLHQARSLRRGPLWELSGCRCRVSSTGNARCNLHETKQRHISESASKGWEVGLLWSLASCHWAIIVTKPNMKHEHCSMILSKSWTQHIPRTTFGKGLYWQEVYRVMLKRFLCSSFWGLLGYPYSPKDRGAARVCELSMVRWSVASAWRECCWSCHCCCCCCCCSSCSCVCCCFNPVLGYAWRLCASCKIWPSSNTLVDIYWKQTVKKETLPYLWKCRAKPEMLTSAECAINLSP